jgi:hypothetical protein
VNFASISLPVLGHFTFIAQLVDGHILPDLSALVPRNAPLKSQLSTLNRGSTVNATSILTALNSTVGEKLLNEQSTPGISPVPTTANLPFHFLNRSTPSTISYFLLKSILVFSTLPPLFRTSSISDLETITIINELLNLSIPRFLNLISLWVS